MFVPADQTECGSSVGTYRRLEWVPVSETLLAFRNHRQLTFQENSIVTTQNKAFRKLIVPKLLNKSDLNIYNRI